MTDKELLEMAARAAGIEVVRSRLEDLMNKDFLIIRNEYREMGSWNPLTDDGDALRLAVKLSINLEFMETLSRKPFGINAWPVGRGDCGVTEEDAYVKDRQAATRRAIVRAAAETGKAANA